MSILVQLRYSLRLSLEPLLGSVYGQKLGYKAQTQNKAGGAYMWELFYNNYSSREISIPEMEVIDIDEPVQQITAWYCLKYSRYILHQLLESMVK